MQKLAVPSAVAKDVELFLAWIPTQRTAQGHLDKKLPDAPGNNGAPPPISKTEPQPEATPTDTSNKELPAAPVQ